MNFIVIMSDTLRPDHLRPYGNDWIHTPTAERFAQEAAVFDRAYCGSFATIPNRTDFFTGRWGGPFHPWLPLAYGETTLPQLLGENGYVTQLICDTPHLIQGGHNFDYPFHAWQFIRGQEVDRFGMDHDPIDLPFKDSSKVNCALANKSLCQYMRNIRGRRHEEDWAGYQTFQTAVDWLARNHKHEKFFLWIDGFDPHEPPWPPQKYIDMYDPEYDGDAFVKHGILKNVTEREAQHLARRYAASVTFEDRNVGRLLQTLDDLGLAEDTCVVWVSDHGTHLAEHGRILIKHHGYEEVARIVYMIRAPQAKARGTHLQNIVQPADLAPTLLDLAGLPVPERMQGVSLAPLLGGTEMETRKVAITGNIKPCGWDPDLPIRACDGRWALIDYVDPAKWELYDLQTDPEQLTNLAQENPDEAKRLHQTVLDFLREHETPPVMLRCFETGDPAQHTETVCARPGYEDFKPYFSVQLLNSRVLPE